MHAVEVAKAWYIPEAHDVHTLAVEREYWPEGHVVYVATPVGQ